LKSIWKYQDLLPFIQPSYRLTLGEGNTPLVRSRYFGRELGMERLFFKLENLNPTGSYKDRFAAIAVGQLLQNNLPLCLGTSSGNTGAALAAYSAASGITCVLLIVEGAPADKIKQMQLYGAHPVMVKGFGKDAVVTDKVFGILAEYCSAGGALLPISAYKYCSPAMQGVQTIAYEIVEQTEDTVDHIFSPSGGGGLALAIAKGVIEFTATGNTRRRPAVHCVQPEGNDSIAGRLRQGYETAKAVQQSTTTISGLQVPGVLDGDELIRCCRMLKGNGHLVGDEEVFRVQRLMAQKEGIFCEPAGAVALAGLIKAVREKEISKTDAVVCVVTGSGFKNMEAVNKHFDLAPIEEIAYDAIAGKMETLANLHSEQ